MDKKKSSVRLTEYSHGAGCGCKISPAVLSRILQGQTVHLNFPNLLIGNDTRDDAAVYAINEEDAVISTTDFFMPIVDDPFDFGGIAAVNAISDIYAMGGKPLMAIAILGWPVNVLDPEIAGIVMDGARDACNRAGIPLAGGHSIDAPEPIFGLAVTGMVKQKNIKANSSATDRCELFLTKPIGIGILTTAQKRGVLKEEHLKEATRQMLTLNHLGAEFAQLDAIKSMTDVTGFGLLGHLGEICEGSALKAHIELDKIPLIPHLHDYLAGKTFPGGTMRNFESYGHHVSPITDEQKAILCDPQTSGGLLVAVEPAGKEEFLSLCRQANLDLKSFGYLSKEGEFRINVH